MKHNSSSLPFFTTSRNRNKLMKRTRVERDDEMRSQASSSIKKLLVRVFYCTVIRLLLSTGGISSMLLIAEISLSLIYGLKAYTLKKEKKRKKQREREGKSIKKNEAN